jgi:hypothetical protein
VPVVDVEGSPIVGVDDQAGLIPVLIEGAMCQVYVEPELLIHVEHEVHDGAKNGEAADLFGT